MVGDKLVDIEFAVNLGIKPINISSKVTSNVSSIEFARDWRDFQMNIIGKLIS
jgi:histidinol phosphatase-like enzyme